MSADNWAKCHNCKKVRDQKIKDSYGKVSAEEYLKMVNEYDEDIPTLREDYEIGIWDGELTVSYNGCCDKCGFLKEFEHKEVL